MSAPTCPHGVTARLLRSLPSLFDGWRTSAGGSGARAGAGGRAGGSERAGGRAGERGGRRSGGGGRARGLAGAGTRGANGGVGWGGGRETPPALSLSLPFFVDPARLPPRARPPSRTHTHLRPQIQSSACHQVSSISAKKKTPSLSTSRPPSLSALCPFSLITPPAPPAPRAGPAPRRRPCPPSSAARPAWPARSARPPRRP